MANTKRMPRSETVVLVLVAGPVLGLLLGGVYSLPALWITKEREPWLSGLLSVGLALTVFGLGCLAHTPIRCSAWTWAFTICLLQLARAFYGGLGHSLERFGIVHVAALVSTCIAAVAARLA